MNIRRIRDVSVLCTEPRLLIAADSLGSIGEKAQDSLSVSAQTAGYFLARVPLMEIISLGGTPFSFVLTIGNEMQPTGERILRGVREAFRHFALRDEAINGSTEENMPTCMTAAGITIFGEVSADWQEPIAHPGDTLYLLGHPMVAMEVLERAFALVEPHHLYALRADADTGLMIPLGSGGIASEVRQLEREGYHLEMEVLPEAAHSAGPATAVLFSSKRSDLPDSFQGIDLQVVGRFL